jgi:hypothetical protein
MLKKHRKEVIDMVDNVILWLWQESFNCESENDNNSFICNHSRYKYYGNCEKCVVTAFFLEVFVFKIVLRV